jgi:hypothetical protein
LYNAFEKTYIYEMYLKQMYDRMELQTDPKTIKHLLDTLQNTPRHPRYHWAQKEFETSLKKGWVFHSDVEDILIAIDSRLDNYQFRISQYYNLLDITFEEAFFRSRVISTGVTSFDALRPENFVLLMIYLERFGFQVDAERFVNQILPSVKQRSKKVYSLAELEIFWYHRSRHKKEDILFYKEKASRFIDTDHMIRLANGYRINVADPEEQEPQIMRIRASKYRERPQTYSVTCPDCGYDWYKGDPESSMLHRKEHKRRMDWLDPQPKTQMTAELADLGLTAELVTQHSPEWKHTEMYNRALAFKREFHYDFVQWKSKHEDEDPDVHGYLMTNDRGAIIGACAFRNRAEDPNQKKWGLQWLWICPRERRAGHLARRWQEFRKRFGDFIVESPVSDAMQAFLEKHGDSELMHYDR